MQKFKRLAAASLAAVTVATGATAVVAAPAEARIASGKYWYTGSYPKTGKTISRMPATVRGSYFYMNDAPPAFRIHSTRRGGWFNAHGAHVDLRRSGNGYVGTSRLPMTLPDGYARITLTPR